MYSLVICSINPPRLEATLRQFRELVPAGEELEVITITDAQGLCEGYARGLAASHGEHVLFSHDDIEILTPAFFERLAAHLARFDVVGLAGTRKLTGPRWFESGPAYTAGMVAHLLPPPHPPGSVHIAHYGAPGRAAGGMQALDGIFLAFRREVIERVGWDAVTFDGFHLYDLDTTYRAHRMGYQLGVALDLPVLHLSTGTFDERWKRAAQAFRQKHAATLPVVAAANCQFAGTRVASREAARALMEEVIGAL